MTALLTALVVGLHMEKKLTVEFSADKLKLIEHMQSECRTMARHNSDLLSAQCSDHINKINQEVNKRMAAAMIMLSNTGGSSSSDEAPTTPYKLDETGETNNKL